MISSSFSNALSPPAADVLLACCYYCLIGGSNSPFPTPLSLSKIMGDAQHPPESDLYLACPCHIFGTILLLCLSTMTLLSFLEFFILISSPLVRCRLMDMECMSFWASI